MATQGGVQKTLDRSPCARQFGYPEQIERLDKAPYLQAGLLVPKHLGKHLGAARQSEIVGYAQIGKLNGPDRTAPHAQQRQHHCQRASRSMPEYDNQPFCSSGWGKPVVDAV